MTNAQVFVVAIALTPVAWMFIAASAAEGGDREPGLAALLAVLLIWLVVGVVSAWIFAMRWLYLVAA